MGEVIFKLDWELVYEPGEGIEVHLKHGGSLPRDVVHHLTRAGKEVSLALQGLAELEAEGAPEKARKKPRKVRKKIEIEEA